MLPSPRPGAGSRRSPWSQRRWCCCRSRSPPAQRHALVPLGVLRDLAGHAGRGGAGRVAQLRRTLRTLAAAAAAGVVDDVPLRCGSAGSSVDHPPMRPIVLQEKAAAIFRTWTCDEWRALFEQTDACVTPVLTLTEARSHPQLAARQTFVTYDNVVQPAPAPRFSRTSSQIQSPPPRTPTPIAEILAQWR